MGIKRIKPGYFLVTGFLLIILAGSVLLNLPVSKTPDSSAGYLDCLFVSVSAVCVTGLTTVDIVQNFSYIGRIVVLFLIQIGGLGFATVALFILALIGRNISLNELNLAKEAVNSNVANGIIELVRYVLKYAFIIEGTGSILLFFPYYRVLNNFWKALGMGVFHSISAFNNAGFDLNGNLSSLTSFHGDIYVYVVISALIFLGGLGFYVIHDVVTCRKWKKLTLQSKIVISTSVFLVLLGTVIMYLSGTSPADSFFLSVSARTAGFTTINLEELTSAGRLGLIILMFIGASPGSTGGGVKTTTLAVILVSMGTVITGRKPAVFGRKISQASISKALTVFFLALAVVINAAFLLILIEKDKSPGALIFEVVSAAATVGLSISVTPSLQTISKFIIMLVMFIGRLGPLTIAGVLSFSNKSNLDYVEEQVIIG
ncbi:MAG: ATPase [Sphaerochaetaceae bacterium]|nr:ATPase [Sphaerochaetaceae bacterium]